MKEILFVCLGNICRSPAAECIFSAMAEKRNLGKTFRADSAGLLNYHEGERADRRMLRCLNRASYECPSISRPVTADDFSRFSLIVAMDDENIRELKKRCPAGVSTEKIVPMAAFLRRHENRFIPDPYYGDTADFELVVELLEDACGGLIDFLTERENSEK